MTKTIIDFGLNTFTMKRNEEMKTEMFGELTPCPRCNSENLGVDQSPFGVAYQIGCIDCGYRGPMVDLSSGSAGEAWNNQAKLYKQLTPEQALELLDDVITDHRSDDEMIGPAIDVLSAALVRLAVLEKALKGAK